MASISRKQIKDHAAKALSTATRMVAVKEKGGIKKAHELKLWKDVKYAAEKLTGILNRSDLDLSELLCAYDELSKAETAANATLD